MKDQHGFSLLEVLVAFAILSISLGVLLQVFGTGLRSAALSEDYSRAALYAESVLATVGVEGALTPGVEQGQLDDKYFWRSTVTAYTPEDVDTSGLRFEPFEIVVEVLWDEPGGRTRSVTLETLRLAPAPL